MIHAARLLTTALQACCDVREGAHDREIERDMDAAIAHIHSAQRKVRRIEREARRQNS